MSSDEKKFTAEELKAFNGQEEGKPIYLAIRGVVYDVTAGANFYGKGASYNGLTGREAGRALAVMKVDVMETNLDDLTAEVECRMLSMYIV
jgi:membrane-associated progesterone receptor component